VFPDVGFIHEQLELISQGFKVFGSGRGGLLELYRGRFLKELEASGLPVPEYEIVEGLDKLRSYLRHEEDLYIKISRYRRDWETFHWRSWEEDANTLDEYAVALGPFRNRIIFYVFKPINTDIEDGCDTWNVEGRYPRLVVHAMECKDKALIATWNQFDDLPEPVRRVSKAFAPILEEYGYRGPISSEVRITKDGKPFFIDITARFGSPPSQCQAEMIKNYAEVIYYTASGILIDPEPAALFGVQAVVNTGRNCDGWVYLKVKKELSQWLKSAKCVGDGNLVCCPPDPKFTGCEDWLVGIGDTLEDAISHLQHNIGLLPDGVTCDISPVAELIQEINTAEGMGYEFTDQPVPDPEIVLEEG